MSNRVHHVCTFTFDGRQLAFLWFTNERDGVEESVPGQIRVFASADGARAWGLKAGLVVSSDAPTSYNLDAIAEWCAHPTATGIECRVFLDVWNLLADLGFESNSIFRGADRRGVAVYDKLFFGNNLPSVTPPSQAYSPTWSDEEVRELARVLRLGLAEFRSRLPAAAA